MADSISFPEDAEIGEFSPCFIYHEELDLLEWLTEDCGHFSSPVGPPHAADVLWNFDRTKIVGVQIWGVSATIKRCLAEQAKSMAEYALCSAIFAIHDKGPQ